MIKQRRVRINLARKHAAGSIDPLQIPHIQHRGKAAPGIVPDGKMKLAIHNALFKRRAKKGILKEEYNLDDVKSERLREKYETLD